MGEAEEEGGGEEAVVSRAMKWWRKAITNYGQLRGGKGIGRRWDEKIGRVENAGCPRCGEEEETPEHIVFWCGNIRRVKDEKGRREWARKEGMRWDSWDALAMEESGRVDDEGSPSRKQKLSRQQKLSRPRHRLILHASNE